MATWREKKCVRALTRAVRACFFFRNLRTHLCVCFYEGGGKGKGWPGEASVEYDAYKNTLPSVRAVSCRVDLSLHSCWARRGGGIVFAQGGKGRYGRRWVGAASGWMARARATPRLPGCFVVYGSRRRSEARTKREYNTVLLGLVLSPSWSRLRATTTMTTTAVKKRRRHQHPNKIYHHDGKNNQTPQHRHRHHHDCSRSNILQTQL